MRYEVFRKEIGSELQIDPHDRIVEPVIRRVYDNVKGLPEVEQRQQMMTFVDVYRAARTLANAGFIRDFRKLISKPSSLTFFQS
ncbi:MAG: hypothetical protein AABX10_02845 [Nanoarchaeota archaeon]